MCVCAQRLKFISQMAVAVSRLTVSRYVLGTGDPSRKGVPVRRQTEYLRLFDVCTRRVSCSATWQLPAELAHYPAHLSPPRSSTHPSTRDIFHPGGRDLAPRTGKSRDSHSTLEILIGDQIAEQCSQQLGFDGSVFTRRASKA